MPGLTPGRRWQPAYSPFKQQNFGDRALQVLEYSVKGPLFGCRPAEAMIALDKRTGATAITYSEGITFKLPEDVPPSVLRET